MRNIEQKKRQGRANKDFQLAVGQRAWEELLAEFAPQDEDQDVKA